MSIAGRYIVLQQGFHTPCWIWQGHRNAKGYGTIHVRDSAYPRGWRTTTAHRASWEEQHGRAPAGCTVDHLCRVRSCVNPEHLEAVPHAENLRRGVGQTPRAACRRGHAYLPDNTILDRNGKRYCRTCLRDKKRACRRMQRSYGPDQPFSHCIRCTQRFDYFDHDLWFRRMMCPACADHYAQEG